MSELAQLLATIKLQLKSRGLTYRDVARAMKLSEASVKRLFSSERLTVERLAQISRLLGLTMAELLQEAAAALPPVHTLSETQEAQLVSDPTLLLVAVCAFNQWTVAEMVATYRLTLAECLKRALVLDRMGVIDLLPGNRIRLRVARDFDWLPGGPIRKFFVGRSLRDFLSCRFDRADESLVFVHGMLTAAAQAEMLMELQRLRSRLAALHRESASASLPLRRGTGILLAMREWEPAEFATMRRVPAL